MKKAIIVAILLALVIPAMCCFGPGEPDKTADVKCPVDCICMTEAQAKELGYDPCDGVKTQCGTDVAGTIMYCFGPGEPDETVDVQCSIGCECMTELRAKELGYDPCDGVKTQCGTDSAGNIMYCFGPGEPDEIADVQCPVGCNCMTELQAKELGYDPCNGIKTQCGTDSAGNTMYCFGSGEPDETAYEQCPVDCSCMTEVQAKERGYDPCNGVKTQCGTDPAGNIMYCFEPVQTQTVCPTGCECMTEAEAKRLGYNLCNGQKVQCGTNPLGVATYCFQKPAEQIEKITVSPPQSSNPVGLLHTITIVVYGANGKPIPNVTIKVVHSGAQSIGPLYFVTGADGSYDYTYKSQYYGTEKVTVSADGISAEAYTDWYIQKTTTFR
jgi:hypothetical protein